MATQIFTPRSAEAGWQPFMDWLTEHGLNPNDVRQVTVDGAHATVELLQRDGGGRIMIDRARNELVTEIRTIQLACPPPQKAAV